MMEHHYFDSDGHLTDQALGDLIYGSPDELSRLEIAEHLSFCDRCTERYTEMLCDDRLTAPQEPLAPLVEKRLRQNAKIIFFNRYVRVGVAACLTLVVWLGGSLLTDGGTKHLPAGQPDFFAMTGGFSDRITSFSRDFSDGVNQLFDQFNLKGVL